MNGRLTHITVPEASSPRGRWQASVLSMLVWAMIFSCFAAISPREEARRQAAFFSPLDPQKGVMPEERTDDYACIKERRFFDYLMRKKIDEFTPIEMAKAMKVTNRTIINWAVALAKNGLLEPQLVQKRIRSYRVVQCSGC